MNQSATLTLVVFNNPKMFWASFENGKFGDQKRKAKEQKFDEMVELNVYVCVCWWLEVHYAVSASSLHVSQTCFVSFFLPWLACKQLQLVPVSFANIKTEIRDVKKRNLYVYNVPCFKQVGFTDSLCLGGRMHLQKTINYALILPPQSKLLGFRPKFFNNHDPSRKLSLCK